MLQQNTPSPEQPRASVQVYNRQKFCLSATWTPPHLLATTWPPSSIINHISCRKRCCQQMVQVRGERVDHPGTHQIHNTTSLKHTPLHSQCTQESPRTHDSSTKKSLPRMALTGPAQPPAAAAPVSQIPNPDIRSNAGRQQHLPHRGVLQTSAPGVCRKQHPFCNFTTPQRVFEGCWPGSEATSKCGRTC